MKKLWIIIVENLETHEDARWKEWLSEDRVKAQGEARMLVEQINRESEVQYRFRNIIDPD